MKELTHLSLFSGIGGLDLAAEWAGFTTVGQCEFADYPTKILEKHWPDVPRWRDIRTLTKGEVENATGLRTVDVISGGFPCQPFSVAGKRKGKTDDRYLWPEMFRVVKELRPNWIIGENVAGFVSMGIDTAISDLESQGYTVRPFIIPACAVGAYHRRDRVAIVANISSRRLLHWEHENNRGKTGGAARTKTCTGDKVGYVANNNGKRMERDSEEQILWERYIPDGQTCEPFQGVERRFNTYKSRICRSLYGIPNGVDRVRALGNSVVPQQFYPIFKAIADIEMGI